MEFGLLCVCINQNKFCLSAYHVISQWILSHIAITQLAPILLICKNIFLVNIISDNMSLNKVVFCFSKAMDTLQQERFEEFGYTYIAPRWVVLTFTIHPLYTIQEIPTDQCCFFREYCKELKLSLNNTQFLLDFNQYIDRNTPDACESCIFFSVISLCTFVLVSCTVRTHIAYTPRTADGMLHFYVCVCICTLHILQFIMV